MGSSSIRKEWEGQVVDGRFALLAWLGGTADRDVFAARGPGGEAVAIKLIAATGVEADRSLGRWVMARAMAHPGLTRVLEAGRCTLDNLALVYVVTERAATSLDKRIRERALGPVEAKAVFGPVAEALAYLHASGLVHGGVKPQNILLVDGHAKLSGEDLVAAGSTPAPGRKPGNYDAPESMNAPLTAAHDCWGVGMCLAEAMTQQLPRWRWAGNGGPVVPDALPEPFYGIVRDCLDLTPERRATMAAVAAQLESVQSSAEESGEQEAALPAEPADGRAAGHEAGADAAEAHAEREHWAMDAVRMAEERLQKAESDADGLLALNAALAAVLRGAVEAERGKPKAVTEEAPAKLQPEEAVGQVEAVSGAEAESREEPETAQPAVQESEPEAAALAETQTARWEELSEGSSAAAETGATVSETEDAAPSEVVETEDAKSPKDGDPVAEKKGTVEEIGLAAARVDEMPAARKSRWEEDEGGERPRVASRWEQAAAEAPDAAKSDAIHSPQYVEALEEEQAPQIFARIEDTHLGGFRLLPWLIGVMVVLAVAGGVLVRMGAVKIPWPSVQLSAQKAPPAAAPSAPQAAGAAQTAQPGTGQTPPGQQPQSPAQTSAAQAGGVAGASTAQGPAPAPAPSVAAATGSSDGGNAAGTAGAAEPKTGGAHNAATPNAGSSEEPGGRSMEGQSEPPAGGEVPGIRKEPSEPAAKGKSVGIAKDTEPAAQPSHPENADGAVAKQVMPPISQAARGSMRGPVEVTLRVNVSREGKVEYVAYVWPDEGNYFARTAWRAAHDWEFTPPYRDGLAETSTWTLHFYFEREHTGATATQDGR